MAVIGGMGGHIEVDDQVVSCIRNWGISHNAGLQAVVCSATRGGRMRFVGNHDWTGKYSAYGAVPAVLPGQTFKFDGAITGEDASAVGASGDAICESVVINWDIEGGGLLNHEVNFASMGPLTLGTITAAADEGIPSPEGAAGLVVKSRPYPAGGAPGSLSAIAEVRTATLTLSRENLSYVSSSTEGQTKRFKGNFDATLALAIYAAESTGWAALPQPNECHEFQLFVDGTRYWLLKWMLIADIGGMDVDVESGALVACTLTANFTGFWNPNNTWTIGEITDPDSGAVWPED